MYAFPPDSNIGGKKLSFPDSRLRGNDKTEMTTFYIFYLSMLRYCVLLIVQRQSPMQNLLRWLLRRGSPLPIPNREVKPDCADGTAVMWESMSLPFFMEPYSFIWIGFFVFQNYCSYKQTKVCVPHCHWQCSS